MGTSEPQSSSSFLYHLKSEMVASIGIGIEESASEYFYSGASLPIVLRFYHHHLSLSEQLKLNKRSE